MVILILMDVDSRTLLIEGRQLVADSLTLLFCTRIWSSHLKRLFLENLSLDADLGRY